MNTERKCISTHKGISDHIGRSNRWCRYMARRELDPLPTFKIGGIVCMYVDEYEAWVVRHRERPQRLNSFVKLRRLLEEFIDTADAHLADELRELIRRSMVNERCRSRAVDGGTRGE